MNQEEYYFHLKAWAKSQRTELLNSEKYGILSIHLLLQLLNLMENRISTTHFVPYKPNIELISLYKEYLTLQEQDFTSKSVESLKDSLDNSLYASIVPALLGFEMQYLIPNKPESFLVLPLTIAYSTASNEALDVHEISCRIQKKNQYLLLEIFDKSHVFHTIRKNQKQQTMDPNPNNRNTRDVINYFYVIPSTKVQQLALILAMGITDFSTQKNEVLEKKEALSHTGQEQPNLIEVFFSKLSLLSVNEHYGELTSTSQEFIGNCLVKELDIALKTALGETRFSEISKIKYSLSLEGIQAKYLQTAKLPNVCSTKDIYLTLTSILMERLLTLQFDPAAVQPMLTDIFCTYTFLKSCRHNQSFKKKFQLLLTNQFYKSQDLELCKISTTAIPSDLLQLNKKKCLSIRAILRREQTNLPKNLATMKKNIKKEERAQQKKFKDSLKKCSKER
ncbi:hypothetical protein E0L10_06000 [Enterococcus durans]|uniref:hypothetical protein n=1 Tax=Enterococcus durans TaxID=53345 RepID=UPI001431D241|nr:hypothetical protein [Enterococcus durans]NJE63707.1 hypothetical protein [Enterococcus durans]